MRRLVGPIAAVVLAAALLAGCGGSSSGGSSDSTGAAPSKGGAGGAPAGASAQACETGTAGGLQLRATAVSCGEARAVMLAWQRQDGCAAAPGASHSACTIRHYRCIGTVTAVGLAVSCARPGHAIAFVARS